MKELLADLGNAERNLRQRAERFPDLLAHVEALARLQALVSARPRVILVGESNVGKTSIANLLLDQAVLPDSVVANTRRPVVLHHSAKIRAVGVVPHGRIDLVSGHADATDIGDVERLEVGLPSARLVKFDLIDTPGITATQELDPLELRPSDVLLWCTIATQAWKASERALWLSLPARHRRLAIMVVTHLDGLRGEEDVSKVTRRLAIETEGGFRAIVFVGATVDDDGAETRAGSGILELDRRIDESLAAIAQRRCRAAYRIANYIVSDSMEVIAGGRPASSLRAIAARLLGRRRPVWRSIMRVPPPGGRERRLRPQRCRATDLADAQVRSWKAVTP